MMKKIKDEIARIEGAKGNVVLVNKKSYLALLKELSVLRFKVHRAENWETPAAVVSVVRRGYMYQYWYPENKPAQHKGEHKMAEQKKTEAVEVKVAAEKVAAFQKTRSADSVCRTSRMTFMHRHSAATFRSKEQACPS